MSFEPPRLWNPDFRFELRPHDVASAKALQEAAAESTAHVCPWMAWLHDGYTLKEAQDWTAHAMKGWRDDTEYHFLIYDRKDAKLTGCCGLNQINRKDLVCNLGYWIRASKLRLGAATQGVALLKDWALRSRALTAWNSWWQKIMLPAVRSPRSPARSTRASSEGAREWAKKFMTRTCTH